MVFTLHLNIILFKIKIYLLAIQYSAINSNISNLSATKIKIDDIYGDEWLFM